MNFGIRNLGARKLAARNLSARRPRAKKIGAVKLNSRKLYSRQGCRRTFFKCELPFFFSYNGDFVAFLMQWEPNRDQIGPVKLKNGDLWLLNCKIWAKLDP